MKTLVICIIALSLLLALNVPFAISANDISLNTNNDNSDNSTRATVRGVGAAGAVGGDGFVINDVDIDSEAVLVSDAELHQTIETSAERIEVRSEHIDTDVHDNIGVIFVNTTTGSFNNFGNLNNFSTHVDFHP
ncbi:MAG: hypothetical protein C4526_09100 [Nitrospiraceae bacterium]|nr:MAG: hypothetical protein C4526_09100 [Nitrospiraceae bacterium]